MRDDVLVIVGGKNVHGRRFCNRNHIIIIVIVKGSHRSSALIISIVQIQHVINIINIIIINIINIIIIIIVVVVTIILIIIILIHIIFVIGKIKNIGWVAANHFVMRQVNAVWHDLVLVADHDVSRLFRLGSRLWIVKQQCASNLLLEWRPARVLGHDWQRGWRAFTFDVEAYTDNDALLHTRLISCGARNFEHVTGQNRRSAQIKLAQLRKQERARKQRLAIGARHDAPTTAQKQTLQRDQTTSGARLAQTHGEPAQHFDCDAIVREVEQQQLAQMRQRNATAITQTTMCETKHSQIGTALKVHQGVVLDARTREIEHFQTLQTTKILIQAIRTNKSTSITLCRTENAPV
jgi:hypothetical protein